MPEAQPESKPVVWITRTREGADKTARALEAIGCEAIIAPVLQTEILPVDLNGMHFDAVIVTGLNGLKAFCSLSKRRSIAAWCVGAATAEAARSQGFMEVHSAEGDVAALFEYLKANALRSQRFLYAAPLEPAAPLMAWLWAEGFSVGQFPVYDTRTIVPAISTADLGRVTHVLIHSPKAGRAVAAFLAHGKFAFTNSCFICMSEAAWQAFATACGTEGENNPLMGVTWRISPFPDEPSMLKLIAT